MGVLVELVLEVHGCWVAQSAGDNIGPYDRNRRQCRRHFTGLERHLTGWGKISGPRLTRAYGVVPPHWHQDAALDRAGLGGSTLHPP